MPTKLALPLLVVLQDESDATGQEPIQAPPTEYSLRSSNTVTEHHEYVYASGKLMRETITTTSGDTTTTQVLDFIYGSGSTPLALVYTNGTASPVTYYYVTNMQGDVVKLVRANGTTVASYAYDAWGRVTTATGSMAEVNPIRYRGYYFDEEIGMYYLMSRFYDPGIRRFINADAFLNTHSGSTGYNMFAYCGNNPVRRIDFFGFNWLEDPWGSIEEALGDVWEQTCEAAEDAWDWACDTVEEAWDSACETVENIYDYVTNTDEEVVLEADGIAFYNGVPVIRLPIGWNAAFYGVIFLGDKYTNNQYGRDTLNHEYGHSLQMDKYGPLLFTTNVATPSLVGNGLNRLGWLPCNYFSLPWEHEADILGGVTRANYETWAPGLTKVYSLINDILSMLVSN